MKRVVVVREMSLEDLREFRNVLLEICDVEVFVYGFMCMVYFGKCLLLNYLNGRDFNRGVCL